jgi:hypothetical protein
MLGPLYHLVERTERIRAIREAHRILKPRDCLFVATISRFASLMAALLEQRPRRPDLRLYSGRGSSYWTAS